MENFDSHHHVFVFVFHDVAVKYEALDNLRVCKGNSELGLARFSILLGRNTEGVAKAVEIGGSAVYLCDQESGVMNMKVKLTTVAGEHNRIRERLSPLLGVHACVQTTAMPKAILVIEIFRLITLPQNHLR
jgi:hypothetical protein